MLARRPSTVGACAVSNSLAYRLGGADHTYGIRCIAPEARRLIDCFTQEGFAPTGNLMIPRHSDRTKTLRRCTTRSICRHFEGRSHAIISAKARIGEGNGILAVAYGFGQRGAQNGARSIARIADQAIYHIDELPPWVVADQLRTAV